LREIEEKVRTKWDAPAKKGRKSQIGVPKTAKIPRGEAPLPSGSFLGGRKGFSCNELRRARRKFTRHMVGLKVAIRLIKRGISTSSNTKGQAGEGKLSTRGIPS
jgi:hypothetical protein